MLRTPKIRYIRKSLMGHQGVEVDNQDVQIVH
jgi:hypothetical protein